MFKKFKRYIYKLTHPIIGEIWQLHRVTPYVTSQSIYKDYDVTPDYLESLISEYQHKGYVFISIDELVTNFDKYKKKRCKFVCITLDDGYDDNLLYAYPIFEKFKTPFLIYVTTGYVEGKVKPRDNEECNVLSIEQLVEINKSPLCTIGCHTLTHPHLSTLDEENQIKEIIDSKRILESWLNDKVNHFAYPYGDYNSTSLEILKMSEFSTAVAAWGGGVRELKSIYEIPRVLIKQE